MCAVNARVGENAPGPFSWKRDGAKRTASLWAASNRFLATQRPCWGEEKRRDFEAYAELVEEYTAKYITRDEDCLPALPGVTFERIDDYLAGVWRSMLIESLHWATKSSLAHGMAYRPHQ
jgi:hypothetical protein